MMKNCYECVGVGCGPSNLSVAALLHANTEIRSIFFEKRSEFSWHPGMMFSGSELQVSQFKDLVTLADPTNRFSFISYLHTHDRLHQFLNAQFAHISRREGIVTLMMIERKRGALRPLFKTQTDFGPGASSDATIPSAA